jgi:hypothetical protein
MCRYAYANQSPKLNSIRGISAFQVTQLNVERLGAHGGLAAGESLCL